MRYRRLGKTDLQVSTIALGTWAYGGDWGPFDEVEAQDTIHRALDLGITLFDTAQAYGFGVSERLLGAALWKAVRRDDVLVATKGGLRIDGDQLLRDASARWLRQGVEASLKNLATDYIDLYQVHWPDLHTAPEETAGVLRDLVAEGKIRHAGVSNYDPEQMDELARFAPLETLQPPYHMFHRDIDQEILPYTAAHDIGVLVYGPLAHGMLGGQMTSASTFPPDDWRSQSPDFAGERFRHNLKVVEQLKVFAKGRGIALPQLAVAWAITHPAVQVAIVGARRPSQLESVAPAGDLELSESERREIDEILSSALRIGGPSPEGM